MQDAPALFEAQPRSTVEDGNYVATVKAVARDVITPRTGRNAGKEVDVVRWTWWLDAVSDEVEGLTGVDPTSEKSNLFAYLVALIGSDRSTWLAQQPSDLIGRKALVQVVNDADGWPKVTNVTPLPKGMQTPTVPAVAAAPVAPAPLDPGPAAAPTDVVSPLRQEPPAEPVPADADDLPF